MKKALLSLALFALVAVGCGKDEGGESKYESELEGVVTIGLDQNTYYTMSGTLDLTWRNPDNLYAYWGEIASVGKVSGLAGVKSIPTAGWAPRLACEVGHGYVMRGRRTLDEPYVYARIYVVERVVSKAWGVVGVKVRVQYPFAP